MRDLKWTKPCGKTPKFYYLLIVGAPKNGDSFWIAFLFLETDTKGEDMGLLNFRKTFSNKVNSSIKEKPKASSSSLV